MNTSTNDGPPKDRTTWTEGPALFVKGLCMGTADVIPGVSGGTMALITGIYTRLIEAIKSLDTTAVSLLLRGKLSAFFGYVHWKFLLVLLSGILGAVLFFTRVVSLPLLIFVEPELVYGLFFGLIVGSVVLLLRDVRPIKLSTVVYLALGTLLGWWVVTLVPTSTPNALWFIFVAGAVAICAMILPGISGSFILLILGKYTYIFGQFAELGGPNTAEALVIMAVFGAGLVTGITLFSRFLSWLLKMYGMQTMSILIGFLIGSLVVIWPWQHRVYETESEPITVASSDARFQAALEPGQTANLPDYYVKTEAQSPDPAAVPIARVRTHVVQTTPVQPYTAATNRGASSLAYPVLAMVAGLAIVLAIGRKAIKMT